MGDRTPVIVGARDYPLTNGKVAPGVTPLRIQAVAARQALADAGLNFQDVDGLATAGAWSVAGAGQHITLTVGEYLGVRPRYVDSTNIGGASFEAHLAHAALALQAGYCEVVLITYGSTQRSAASRTLAGRAPELNMQFETPWGMLTPVGAYALAAARYMYERGDIREALATIAVNARRWAALNPAATRRDPLTVSDVLASPMISDPLRLLDCCLVTDGGGAVVITTRENVASPARPPIRVAGYAESQCQWTMASTEDLTLAPAAGTGERALQMAGFTHADIDVAELYDSFTITVFLTLEALGFCERGAAREFLSEHDTGPGGSFPMNTSGGGLSYMHPGMFGIHLITEACRQLWGEAGDAQVPDARVAFVSGTGATLSASSACVLERL
jgi:acetyl-CoA acetyltransferase